MTMNELTAQARADSAERTKRFDDEALLAAEAFSFGVFDKYIAAKVEDIERRINSQFGASGGGPSVFADPATL